MRYLIKSVCWTVMILIIMCSLFTASAKANVPYYTFTREHDGELLLLQAMYTPKTLMGHAASPLSSPQDIFIDTRDEIYIVDTGNNRVVHLDQTGQPVRMIEIPESPLDKPHGVYVSDEGNIYIADTGNSRIVILDADGHFIQEIKRPDSKYYPSNETFEPIKLVVDNRGFMYVLSRGSYRGLVLFDTDGDFNGFYGSNPTEAGLLDRIRIMLYSDEQLSRRQSFLPKTVNNLDVDQQGFIYSVTAGSASEQIKKLNIRGSNVWQGQQFAGFVGSPNKLVDVAVDKHGIVTAVDPEQNTISQYDNEGRLLFFWSGRIITGNPQFGLPQSPVSVDLNSQNELYILDDSTNVVQVFEPTELGKKVHEGIKLTQDGKYELAEQYWADVVRLNANFPTAYEGLAKSAYRMGDYRKAMKYAKLAGNVQVYSDAFWQVRVQWFQNRFSWLATILLILGLIWLMGGRRIKQSVLVPVIGKAESIHSNKLVQQLLHGFFILKKPTEGFSDLRYEEKGSLISAGLIWCMALLSLVFSLYLTNYVFLAQSVNELDIGAIIIPFVSIWISWVICHYLVSSIYRGEGRFKDVIIGSSYVFMPLILIGLPLAIVSNAMTLQEETIYNYIEWAMLAWIALLLFWKVKAIQNYNVSETLINILFTIFAILILWILIFIVFGLFSELIEFIYSIYQEVLM